MRRNASNPTTYWSARVSSLEKSEFKHLLPIHGAQTACITIALEKFLDFAEASADVRRFVHDDIQRHLHEESRSGPTEEITVTINSNLYIRFNELFPEQGGTSWFIRRTLQAVIVQLAEFVLDERIELAVRSILQPRLESGTE
jgi:hypothetical protein